MKKLFNTLLILFIGSMIITGCEDSSNSFTDFDDEEEEETVIYDTTNCTSQSGKIVACTGKWEWVDRSIKLYDDAIIYGNFGDNNKLKCATMVVSFEYGIDATSFYVVHANSMIIDYHWQGKKYPGYRWAKVEDEAKVTLDDFISYSRYELNTDVTNYSKSEFESFLNSELPKEFTCK